MEFWKKKALKDAMKSFLPLQPQLRALKRRVTPYRDNRGNSMLAMEQGLQQISLLRNNGQAIDGIVLEFGSGWLPLIPILFHIAGAQKIIMTDVERLMDKKTTNIACKIIIENCKKVSAALDTPTHVVTKKIENFDFEYIVPFNIKEIPDESIDLIISRAVFEHIPHNQVASLFSAFRRIIKPNGSMCHVIDNSDHAEHQDKSISRLNFLQFESNDFWWRVNCINQQNYQNRLRHNDYLTLLRNTGWDVVQEIGEPDNRALRDLPTLKLASEYRGKTPEDLAILTSFFVAHPNLSDISNKFK